MWDFKWDGWLSNTGKMASEHRLEGTQGVCLVDLWGESIPECGKDRVDVHKCYVPETFKRLV
jgi:hypothetical protein